ncbi:MAG TPA: glutamate synthase subunit alpha, partial [Candidatus Dormibacteraeota bacterium]
MPTDRDLRDPSFEHDGCGVAFVATTSGIAGHHIVAAAMRALVNLGHRGATGSDPDTGDGAGILLQVPDAFLRKASGVELPPAGSYGVGMVFLPATAPERRVAQSLIAACCADEGVHLLGWREVPVDAGVPGVTARAAMPRIRQFFVAAVGIDGDALERRLYVLRRVIEARARESGMDRRLLHVASLSSRTVVYKGMLTAEQLGRFYADLRDTTVRSALAIVHAR